MDNASCKEVLVDDPNELKSLFERAAEIAGTVPDHLQETAFNRALDALMAGSGGGVPLPEHPPADPPEPRHPAPSVDLARYLVESMNATDHPEIRTADSVLDRALAVLHASRSGHRIDGLTPGEIAAVLSQKFRIATRTLTVSDALGKVAGHLVDRVKEGRGYRYRIMEAGEERVAAVESGSAKGSKKATARPKRKIARPAVPAKPRGNSKRRSGGRPGPKKMLSDLIDKGFFASPRIISAIIGHVEETRGRSYTAQELSPALVRLLRDGRLGRAKNGDGQYEYSAE